MKFPFAIPSEIIVFFGNQAYTIFWWAKPSHVSWSDICTIRWNQKMSFFCPTCVCYTRGWLPGVWEPFLSFRFPATIRSRGPRGRAAQCIHGTISQILYLIRTSRLMKFLLPALYKIVFSLKLSSLMKFPFLALYKFFFWGETTIKSLLSTRSFFF